MDDIRLYTSGNPTTVVSALKQRCKIKRHLALSGMLIGPLPIDTAGLGIAGPFENNAHNAHMAFMSSGMVSSAC
jgi:hypothetical protein